MTTEQIAEMAASIPKMDKAEMKERLTALKKEGVNLLGLICFVHKNQKISLN